MLVQGRLTKSSTSLLPELQRRTLEKLLFFASFGLIGFLVVLSFSQLIHPTNLFNQTTTPRELVSTNVTDVSFTLGWTTNGKTTGWVVYGKTPDNLNLRSFDNYASGDMSSFAGLKHRITLTNLEPNTYYYYEVVSGGKQLNSVGGEILKPIKTAAQSILTNPSLNGNQP